MPLICNKDNEKNSLPFSNCDGTIVLKDGKSFMYYTFANHQLLLNRPINIENNTMLQELLGVLTLKLEKSNGSQRMAWAATIIEQKIKISSLLTIIENEPKRALRFMWLLSDIGNQSETYLSEELPFLWDYFKKSPIEIRCSFAAYWHYCGVPLENEGEAIDFLFCILNDSSINVTVKSRAAWVLVKMAQKYPDLKPELLTCLSDQKDLFSADFSKRIQKLIIQLK